ncbi:MAG: LLM class F420-dependent oxidoreductase [Dehalococcoidia bacterium]
MKAGFTFFGLSPRTFAAVARKAEEVGFESLWVPEHLVFPADIPATYPYAEDGRAPIVAGTPLYDPWVVLSYAAAVTDKVRLGTSVYILPLRNPFVTARAVVTLDRLSQGRAILGVGIGWLQEEFEVVGEEFDNRAQRATEIVEIIKALWTEETIEYHGQHYSFGPVKFSPKPAQKPHPPIEFGGETPAALRRAGTLGDGWIGVGGHTPDRIRAIVRRINQAREAAGRLDRPFEITVGGPQDPSLDDLKRLEEAGVTRVNLRPVTQAGQRVDLPDLLASMERLGNDIIARL